MKNILVCACDYDVGSSGAFHFSHFILELNNESTDYRVWLLTDDFVENAKPRNEKTVLYIRKVPFNYSPKLFPVFHFLRNWAYYKAIRRFQKENNVDAVLFSQAFFGVLSRLLLPRRIKIAGIIHDAHALESNRSSFFTYKAFIFNQLTQRPLEWLSNYLLDFTVANSKAIYDLILKKRRLLPERVSMIYQSIDIRKIEFRPPNWLYTEGSLIKILFIKSGFTRGGLPDLIQALGLLTYKFQLTIVGPNISFKPQFEALSKDFTHISLNCVGHKNSDEVSEMMYNHHVLCIPARHEALGLTNVEGLAHGISVVSTHVGGVPEVLDKGNCGWLAEAENPVSLAEALKNCIEADPSVRKEKSRYGRQHVEQFFSKETMLQKCLDLFDKMTVRP